MATLSYYHKNGSTTTIVQTLEYYTTRVAEGIKLEYKFYTYRSNTSYQGSPTNGQISYYVRVNNSNINSGSKSSLTVPNGGTPVYLFGDEKSLLSHIIEVGETNSGSFTLSFETTTKTTGLSNFESSKSTTVKYDAYTTKGKITKVPFRYYINYGNNDRPTDTKFTGDFVNATNDVETDNYRDTVNSHNVVTWNKNGGTKFKLLLEYPKESKQWYKVYEGSGTSYNLSEDKIARAVGLMSMEKGTNYYGGKTQPLSRYYDTRVALDSYKGDTYIGSDYHDIRIEMYLPQVPSSIGVTQISGEDYAYESNEFKASWPITSRCNQYIIRYAVNSPTNVNSWTQCAEDIVINGHNTTNTIIGEDSITSKNTCISSLLAGQRIRFNMRGRCSLSTDYTINNVTKTITYTYDSAETSTVELQKQGGMVTYIRDNNEDKYQNCHVCVVDNNGKLVKALATYVYTYQDGSTINKEWRLIKMNS